MQFSQINLSNEVMKAIEEIGFTEATEIQSKSIPFLLEGKDVIGRSHTGTGKTAAFGIPAIESISKDGSRVVEILIMCPTRELAMQACIEIQKFSKYMPWVKPVPVYGGAPMERQISALKRGANIVVGTPGRIMDHMQRRTLKLENLKTIILDEADEMLNMGFREDIEEILQKVPEERQTVLFSATMPKAIMEISKKYLTDPVEVKVQAKQRTVEAITQYFYDVPSRKKVDALVLLLMKYQPKLAMIFCNTKKMVDELAENLNAKGFKASGIHGDMKQSARTNVMERFKSGRTPILIATDVAARGIDVDDIDAVFNYDIPQDNEYYIHRIGRTGRAGRKGTAFTFASGRKQFFEIRDIQRFTKANIEQKQLPTAEEIKNAKYDMFIEKIQKAISEDKHSKYLSMVEKITADNISEKDLAAILLSMQFAKEIKHIPVVDFNAPKKQNDRFGEKHVRSGGNKCKVVLSSGRNNRIAPNFILGALVEATGLSGKSFGKIDIFDRHSTVEIPASEKQKVLEAMNGSKINGVKVSAEIVEQSSKSGYNNKRRDRSKRFNKSDSRSYNRNRKSYKR